MYHTKPLISIQLPGVSSTANPLHYEEHICANNFICSKSMRDVSDRNLSEDVMHGNYRVLTDATRALDDVLVDGCGDGVAAEKREKSERLCEEFVLSDCGDCARWFGAGKIRRFCDSCPSKGVSVTSNTRRGF